MIAAAVKHAAVPLLTKKTKKTKKQKKQVIAAAVKYSREAAPAHLEKRGFLQVFTTQIQLFTTERNSLLP